MDISSASSLFDNPDVVSDLMPGIHAKFVEIESDFLSVIIEAMASPIIKRK